MNNEIRYSIRSLFKHSIEPIGRIFIVGEKPTFLKYSDRLIHIPHRDTKAKEVNIWEKALVASQYHDLSEEFFFINDDHFFLKDFRMSDYPFYHKGKLEEYPWAKKDFYNLKRSYDIKSAITLKFLRKQGLPTWHYDIHTPKRLEKSKFIESYKFFQRDLYKGAGLLIFSSYCNYHKVIGEIKPDLKLYKCDWTRFLNEHPERDIFSTADDVISTEFQTFMQRLYCEKSPVEK